MKKVFRELDTLKPSVEAKLRLIEKVEEIDMKKQPNVLRKIWKPVMICFIAISCFSIPFLTKDGKNSIEAYAKQVETLDTEINLVNKQYKSGEITYKEYQKKVDPLLEERKETVIKLKSKDASFKVKEIKRVDKNGIQEIEFVIEDAK